MTRKRLAETPKAQALDKGLKDMFKALEQRALPDTLSSVVDQLDEGEGRSPAQELREA